MQIASYSFIEFSIVIFQNIHCIFHNLREVLYQLPPERAERQPDMNVILAGQFGTGGELPRHVKKFSYVIKVLHCLSEERLQIKVACYQRHNYNGDFYESPKDSPSGRSLHLAQDTIIFL